jgi:ATP-dependent Lon protease
MNDTGDLRLTQLSSDIQKAGIPKDLTEKLLLSVEQSESAFKNGNTTMLDQAEKYIRFVMSLPWNKETSDNLDLTKTQAIFDKHHYGMKEIKERITDYLAVLKLKKQSAKPGEELRAPILCFVGLAGTGKTTLAYAIADAMGRKVVRVPFGGMGSALDLRGQSRVHPDSEPGQIMKALIRAGSKNPVLLLDEIDRVSDSARADIMGVLIELLDPEQNNAFTDHYLDYPFDLSHVLFIATANNTKNIATAVLDRLEPIQMPTYTDDEKVTIGKDYIFPRQLSECGINPSQLTIDESLWPSIVRPLGFDSGIRTLERTINGICRKAARILVEQKAPSVTITQENVKEFIPQ